MAVMTSKPPAHSRRLLLNGRRPSPAMRPLLRLGLALAAGASVAALASVAWAQEASKPPPTPGAEQLAPGAERAPDTFMIVAFDVSGVTRLTSAEVEKLIYPYMGPDKAESDVLAAQKALQAAYAAKGYDAVQVDIPIQPSETFSQGIVLIAVNETPVGRVRVVDSRHHALSVVRAQVPSLVEGQPVNLQDLQRDVAAANRFPDRTIDPVFKPGQAPGTLDVDLKVDDRSPLHASLDLNNDNSPNTENLRLAGTIRHTNLWGRGHTASFTYSVAPEDRKQSEVFSGSYSIPFIGTPWSLLVYGYHSNSNVASLGGTNVLGNGTQLGVRAQFRLPTDVFQQISFGLDYKDFTQRVFLEDATASDVPIRYIPFVAEYSLSGGDEISSFGLTVGATAGLRAVRHQVCVGQAGYAENQGDCTAPTGDRGLYFDQFEQAAGEGRENFFHLNLDATYSRRLPSDFGVNLRLSGQIADNSLVTNEQFSLGGMSSIRGYYVSEAVGDQGVVGSVQLESPDLLRLAGSSFGELRLFTFVDAGHVRVFAPALEQTAHFTLASYGGGFRVRLLDYVSGELNVGVPMEPGPTSPQGRPKYSFSLKTEF